MDRSKIDHCVELLSHKGCTEVWRIIAALEAGNEVVEAALLTRDERDAVLAELKSIMAVYERRK